MDLYDTTRPDVGGEARMRRAMARAERLHRRRRGYAVTAGAAVAIVLVLVALGSLARALTSPAETREVRMKAAESPVPGPTAGPAVVPTAAAPAAASDAAAAVPTPAEAPAPKPSAKAVASAPAQLFRIRIGELGYEPSKVSAKASAPIVLAVDKGDGCAAGFHMPALGVKADNTSGPVIVKLGRVKPGSYRFTCEMGMVEGMLVVS
jgi:hypothetical protein